MRGRGGFTLIEVLIVIVILAILISGGYSSYRKVQMRSLARRAAAEVAAAFRDARGLCQRRNVKTRVKLKNTGEYSVYVKSGGTYKEVYTRKFLEGTEFHYKKSSASPWLPLPHILFVSYRPPFAEIGIKATLFRARVESFPEAEACFRVFGVTGRVVMADECP